MIAAFRRNLRSDLLRSISGPSALMLAGMATLIPVLIVLMTGIIEEVVRENSAVATRSVLSLGVAGAAGCAFFGSYLVTRDDYYKSTERAFLLAPLSVVYVSRLAASAISGAMIATVSFALWLAITFILLSINGVAMRWGIDLLAIGLGSVLSGTLCAFVGCAVGWMLRNYYIAVLVLLVVPPILAPLMLGQFRDIERFLPIGAAAALGGVDLAGLLPPLAAGVVLAGWAVLAGLGGWIVLRARMVA